MIRTFPNSGSVGEVFLSGMGSNGTETGIFAPISRKRRETSSVPYISAASEMMFPPGLFRSRTMYWDVYWPWTKPASLCEAGKDTKGQYLAVSQAGIRDRKDRRPAESILRSVCSSWYGSQNVLRGFEAMVGPAAVTAEDGRERSHFSVVGPRVGVHTTAEQGVELFIRHNSWFLNVIQKRKRPCTVFHSLSVKRNSVL